jgi:microcystin-dependent protein
MPDNFTKFVVRSGTETDRAQVVYSEGEPVYVTDYKRLFVGDGKTYGGNIVSNKFLGFATFNLYTNASGIVSAYRGDMVYDTTTNNLYALTGLNVPNIESYARITRNFTTDNVTTVLSQTSGISVKPLALNATYLSDGIVGRGLEKDPADGGKIRLIDPDANGGLAFNVNDELGIASRGVTNEMLADMAGNRIKGNLGIYGAVQDITLQELADRLSPLLVKTNVVFGVPIGTIIDFGGETPPNGYLYCNGQTFSASEYPELYNAIGNTWGGNKPLFALPDLRRKTTIGAGGTKTTTIDNSVGSIGGNENVILKKENIPSHIHELNGIIEGGTSTLLPTGGNLKYNTNNTKDGTLDGLNDGPIGQPANIMQPSAVVMKCIKAF